MNQIIQQITVKMVEEVLKDINENGIHSLGQAIQRVSEIAKSAVLEIISEVIEEMDRSLAADSKLRKNDGLRIKQRNVSRSLLTDIGELTYKRTYFETNDGSYCYLIDHIIGVESYERLTKELCAALVQEAAYSSMEKASKSQGVKVSKQTVNNCILSLKEVVVEAKKAEITPEELHIFADEDHVSLKNGRSTIVPLVTVTEGIDVSNPKRHKTINPIHFAGYNMNNNIFLEGISSYLHEEYDMEKVKRIYMHGDGALWISAARNYLPNVIMVMDGYHLEKRLKSISNVLGSARHISKLRKLVESENFEGFIAYCLKHKENLSEKDLAKLMDHIKFFSNHWSSILNRLNQEVCGSCTEPLVGHVLSKRLSRNPLAWSRHGLGQMAMLITYIQNKGVVSSKDIRVSKKKVENNRSLVGFQKYREYADNQIKMVTTGIDWSIFESSQFKNGKIDGTTILRKAYGRINNTVAIA